MSALHRASGIVAAVLLTMPVLASAQSDPERQSRSAALAAELSQILDQKQLTNIAAKGTDSYVGALYIKGSQLYVVKGKFVSADRMNWLLATKAYRDAYIDLNSASQPESRLFVTDLGANGLYFKSEKDEPFDMVDIGGKSLSFDGKWGGKDRPSRDEYAKTYDTTDEQYMQMLQTLIAELKKSS